MKEIEKLKQIEERWPHLMSTKLGHGECFFDVRQAISIAHAALKREELHNATATPAEHLVEYNKMLEHRITELEQQNNDLAVRHAALLTQNVKQEEEIENLERQLNDTYGCNLCHCCGEKNHTETQTEIANLERQVCGMRETLKKARHVAEYISRKNILVDEPDGKHAMAMGALAILKSILLSTPS